MPGIIGGGGSTSTQYIPYNAGGTGQGGTVFTPANQPQAGQQYQDLVSSFINPYQAGTTAPQVNYPLAENLLTNLYSSPYATNQLTAATQYGPYEQGFGASAIGAANQFSGYPAQVGQLANTTAGYAPQVAGYAPQVAGYAPQVAAGIAPLQQGAANLLQTGYDPQGALYNQLQQQTMANAQAANAAAGLSSSPYGAGLVNQATTNFATGWQNNQLAREQAALQGAGTGYTQAGNLAQGAGSLYTQAGNLLNQAGGLNTRAAGLYGAAPELASGLLNLGTAGVNAGMGGAGLPYQTQLAQLNNILPATQTANQLGLQQYQLPEDTLNYLSNYLNLGRGASLASGTLGETGFQQGQTNLQNLGAGLGLGNSILGNPLGLGTGGLFGSSGGGLFGSSGLLGGLFGGGAAATGADIAGIPGASLATDAAGNIIGTDFLSGLALGI